MVKKFEISLMGELKFLLEFQVKQLKMVPYSPKVSTCKIP
jgi:hypothetical protein